MSARPPTPPTTPPAIAPALLELLVATPEDTFVALEVLVDDVAADVEVAFATSVELQCVKVLLFEDV